MYGHPLVMLGAGICAIVTVAAAAYVHFRSHQFYNSQHDHQEPTVTLADRRILGPCAMCKGEVSTFDGYTASCQHLVHYTCAADILKHMRGIRIDWKKLCKTCLSERRNAYKEQEDKGLRNRAKNVQKCANCLLELGHKQEDIRTLECKHCVHKNCWERMQKSGSPTCPECMEM